MPQYLLVQSQADQLVKEVASMDLEGLARSTGFQKRKQRKINMQDMVLGILSLAATGRVSFERVAASIARCAAKNYSKQAFHKRLKATVFHFFTEIFIRCIQPAAHEAAHKGVFASFRRVLLQDSTTIRLPERYAKEFPGSANQRKAFSQLKIQVVCNLLLSRIEHVAISGFNRNDQRASADILDRVQTCDLVIRDLGYFVLAVFKEIAKRKAFFLSRYRHEVTILDPATARPVSLAKHLKKYGFFDAPVLLGEKAQVPVRLVAIAVPDAVANQRRRHLRQNRDQTLNPSREHFFLLGWNIFVTNVGSDIWPPKVFPVIYRFRWRIETIFKAWKTHLRLTDLSNQCLSMIYLSVMTKLIFCAFVYRTCHDLETSSPPTHHASLLRTAKILSNFAILFEAAILRIPPKQLLALLLQQHGFYEQRPDRYNFQQQLTSALNEVG